jgi:hypothetical protein
MTKLKTSTTSSSKAPPLLDYDTECGLLVTIGIAAYIGNVDVAIVKCCKAARHPHLRQTIVALAALPMAKRKTAAKLMVVELIAQNVLSTK